MINPELPHSVLPDWVRRCLFRRIDQQRLAEVCPKKFPLAILRPAGLLASFRQPRLARMPLAAVSLLET